jgi:hypothetical protein
VCTVCSLGVDVDGVDVTVVSCLTGPIKSSLFPPISEKEARSVRLPTTRIHDIRHLLITLSTHDSDSTTHNRVYIVSSQVPTPHLSLRRTTFYNQLYSHARRASQRSTAKPHLLPRYKPFNSHTRTNSIDHTPSRSNFDLRHLSK